MLSPGTRVGPYEIDSHLGEGGMGVVYRARDTRLGRTSDGRFLRVQRTNIEPTASQMNIVVNWLEELKKLASQK